VLRISNFNLKRETLNAPQAQGVCPMTTKKRILVVDDEPDFCAIVKGNLEKEGFSVEVAYDGVEGLAKVRANPPDAIVLDVMMPEMDGYAVCKTLKKDPKFSGIPVVMLTAVASHVSSTRYSHYDGMSMEADDYLPKPASADAITSSVKGLIGA
jgi:two-component system alkaline phosphatase synthesis response regulator PhoP